MSEAKPVVWFGDDPEPNTFFFRSPFRSWQFILNTGLVVVMCLAYGTVVWKYWDEFGRHTSALPILTLLLLFVVRPYRLAIKRHGKIKELHLSGTLPEQPAGSPIDTLLQVADDSMNEGLLNSSLMFGMYLIVLFIWKFQHIGRLFHP